MSTLQTTETPNRLVDRNPTLQSVLNQLKENILATLNCHAVGTVQSVDYTAQTVQVTINYFRTTYEIGPTGSAYVPTYSKYPVLIDCPMIILQGGPYRLTFPVEQGDECLVLFNDRAIDNWFASGQVGPLPSLRMHSYSDGIALVGLYSKQTALTDYDQNRAVLTNGTLKLGIGLGGIYLADASTTLGTQLQNLVTEIKSLVTAVNTLVTQTALITVTPGSLAGPSSPPLNAAAISAVTSTLSTITSQLSATASLIGGLLE